MNKMSSSIMFISYISSFIYIVVKPSSKAIKSRAGCSNHPVGWRHLVFKPAEIKLVCPCHIPQ